MSFQFPMSSAPRNGSRTRYKTKLYLNFLGEPDVPVAPPIATPIPPPIPPPIATPIRPSTPIKRRGSMMGAMIGTRNNMITDKPNMLLKPPSAAADTPVIPVLQMPIRSRRKSVQLLTTEPEPESNNSSISNHWTNVEKVNKELFRLFIFRSKTSGEQDFDLTIENLDVLDDLDKSVRDSDIITQYVKKQKITKLKIQEPVQQSNWVFDFFEEADYQEKLKKKEKIHKLKIREPIRSSSQWTTSDYTSEHELFDYQYYI